MLKLHLQRTVIKCADAHLGKIGRPAGHGILTEPLRPGDGVKQVGIVPWLLEHPPPRKHEVDRGHRLAVAPAGIASQVKRVPLLIGADINALRHARNRLEGLRIKRVEPFPQPVPDADILNP